MKNFEMKIGNKNIIIDENSRDLMLVRIVEEGKPDKIALARDIFGDGSLDECEIRIDDKYYNEVGGIKRLEELSKELGLEIL